MSIKQEKSKVVEGLGNRYPSTLALLQSLNHGKGNLKVKLFTKSDYRGSPTSTVSSSTISTSTVFQCYVLKTVLVEFLCTINRTSGNQLCSTY